MWNFSQERFKCALGVRVSHPIYGFMYPFFFGLVINSPMAAVALICLFLFFTSFVALVFAMEHVWYQAVGSGFH